MPVWAWERVVSNINVRIVAYNAALVGENKTVNVLSSGGSSASIPTLNQITDEQYFGMSAPDRQGIPTWMAAAGSPNATGVRTILVPGYSSDGFALREDSGLALREDGGRELRE